MSFWKGLSLFGAIVCYASGATGRGFESLQAYHEFSSSHHLFLPAPRPSKLLSVNPAERWKQNQDNWKVLERLRRFGQWLGGGATSRRFLGLTAAAPEVGRSLGDDCDILKVPRRQAKLLA